MAKHWCKVCDEPLRPAEGAFVATCTACGARQALPRPIDDEYLVQIGTLRRLRQSGDFDSAAVFAEELSERTLKDAALYWQRVLIHYQAIYVQETGTHEYSLECHREEHIPIFENEEYKKTLELASPAQRGIYEEDARLLERARRAVCGEAYVPDETVSPLNSGFLCLEDGEWEAAHERFDCALKENSKDALAYFGKLMAELHVRRESELAFLGEKLPETENYQYVLEHGDSALRERVTGYWERSVLAHAEAECEKAETVDDWKRIKKMLQPIAGNARAREYIVLCERKIREIMVRDGMVVIGCREAVNLGLTTETLGVRMVNAHYYYDFDMPAASKSKNIQKGGGRLVLIVVILAMLGLIGIVFYILFGSDAGEFQPEEYNRTTEQAVTTAATNPETDGITAAEPDREKESYTPELCIVGEHIFVLQADGSVASLSNTAAQQTETTPVSGASFAGNVNPYASDWNDWTEIKALYSEPSGEMLFGVTEGGLVVYDIFASSEMKYEEQYRAVSSWLSVKKLVWDETETGNACLFGLSKDGTVYASDAETEEMVRTVLNPQSERGKMIENITAKNGVLHILFADGDYFAVDY